MPPLDGRQVVFIHPKKKIEIRIYPNGLGTCEECSHWARKTVKIFTGTDPLYPTGLCREWNFHRSESGMSCSLFNRSTRKKHSDRLKKVPSRKKHSDKPNNNCTAISIK